jgi:iron-sulfur cluster assembly accessory protein
MNINVTITPAAEKFIRRMVRFGGAPGSGFRLVVTPGGCSGLAAEFDVKPSPSEGDSVLDHNGLSLFLPAESRLLLDGVTIDFADTRTESGLVFHNPKAAGPSCSSSLAMVTLDSVLRRQ